MLSLYVLLVKRWMPTRHSQHIALISSLFLLAVSLFGVLYNGVKVTLSPTLLKIEIAATDADALNGDDVLEITHSTDASDLAEVEETLKNILKGTGTYISNI